jgi:hypothetical protein
MTGLELALSCAPPALAILLQLFPIPNDRWIASQAGSAAASHGLPGPAATVIRETTRGSITISSMAPTIVAYITGAFALLASGTPGAGYLWIYLAVIVPGIAGSVIAAALVLGRSAMAIATGGVPLPIAHFGPTPATLINWGIYLLNGFLIVLSVLAYEHVVGA